MGTPDDPEQATLIHQDDARQREAVAGLVDLVRGERAKHHTGDRAHHKEESPES
ncbi:hypothetical protein [Streptomyces kebangsaanensis]|uniref:hypothetical protein n=1 Tax=Streptomyces kebangsaanensis TaxID=864058 RepID=UPI000B1BB493|nr:hypothetical protein [Streptomyces kebangsaanensis]